MGVQLGVSEFDRVDSSAKAFVLSNELRVMHSNTIASLIQTKEIELDGAIVKAIEFQESGRPWIFWPDDISQDHERLLKVVAQYRTKHPSPGLSDATLNGEAAAEVTQSFNHHVRASTKTLIDRYGN